VSGPPALDARGLPVGYPFKPELEVPPRETRERLGRSEIVLIDVRTPEEWSVARVEGAALIPLHELESRFDEVESALDAAPERDVLFLCHHGQRSIKAALFARARGIDRAFSIAGGIELWSLAADPSVPRYCRDAGGCRPLQT